MARAESPTCADQPNLTGAERVGFAGCHQHSSRSELRPLIAAFPDQSNRTVFLFRSNLRSQATLKPMRVLRNVFAAVCAGSHFHAQFAGEQNSRSSRALATAVSAGAAERAAAGLHFSAGRGFGPLGHADAAPAEDRG